ncbi:MAG: DUF6644 family protein [Steroidobacterales bacterium]
MSISDFLMALQNTPIAGAVRGDPGYEWMFPIVEIFHVFSLTLVFGSIAMVDMRLLGLASRDSAVSKLSAEVLPWTWSAWVFSAISGSLLFMSKAHTYFYNAQFEAKFVLMALAAVNMAVFQFGIYRRVLDWDNQLPPPPAARVAGALSLMLWIGVIFCGRWTGFTT